MNVQDAATMEIDRLEREWDRIRCKIDRLKASGADVSEILLLAARCEILSAAIDWAIEVRLALTVADLRRRYLGAGV